MEESIDIISGILRSAQGENLQKAIREFYQIQPIKNTFPDESHIEKTPRRIVKSMLEMFDGCFESPEDMLTTSFEEKTYDELVYVNGIPFVSNCAHHNLPFFGRVYFAYLPNGRIVGLSKIPRLIRIYSRRPQVQEKLTDEIVAAFDKVINPKGCGIVIEAYHLCMLIRGIEAGDGWTRTTALRGNFKTNDSLKQEFLQGIRKTSEQIWP